MTLVTFQKKLGSYHAKIKRIQETWRLLVHDPEDQYQTVPVIPGVDEGALGMAVRLCKSDLTCELVKEFTELQGIIGGRYAEAQGCDDNVAIAIYDQYKPISSDDEIPRTLEGCLLSICDKLDTIAGMFAIGLEPTGSKDPFALRRAANGVIKILAVWPVRQTRGLQFVSVRAIRPYGSKIVYWEDDERKEILLSHSDIAAKVSDFLRERLHFYLKDGRGFAYDVVNAVLAAGADDVRDAIARAEALTAARESADFAATSAAFKRIKNLLRQAEDKQFAIGSAGDASLSVEAQHLADAASTLAPEVARLRSARAYGEALAAIATLRPAVDAFFDKVMVLDPDPTLRGAHLGLIDDVLRGFSGIADFSEIVVA